MTDLAGVIPEGWQRLHPLSPVVRAGRSLLALVIPLALTAGSASHSSGDLFVDLGIVALALALGGVSWLVTRWRIEDGVLRIDTGLVRRSSRRFPLSQVQAIDLAQPALGRVVGLAEIRLRMAGAAGAAGRLSYLKINDAERLRARLLALAHGLGEHSPAPPERPLVEVSTRRLLLSLSLLSGPGLVLEAAVVGLIAVAVVDPRLAGIFVSAGLTALVGLGTAVWRRLNSGYGLVVSEAADGLRVRSGLLQTTAETIPLGRIQGVRLVEPLLWRPLGWCRLDADVAGKQRGRAENQAEGRTLRALLPVGTRAEALRLLDRILPGVPAERRPPPRRARWKSPLRYRQLSWGANDAYATTTSGRLCHATDWVPLAKVQSLRLVEGPVQRRLALGTVHLDTAGRNVHAALRDRDRGECDTAMADLEERCRQARALAPGSAEVTTLSRGLARLVGLGPALSDEIRTDRDLQMLAAPGVVLLADRWYPTAGNIGEMPIVLLRSPYGRRQLGMIGRLFAERGYQVVIQSCRGTFGSGGVFEPFRHEQEDGRTTHAWLAEQPWWSGAVATFGPSYLGMTQWAIAGDPPAGLRAIAPNVTATHFRNAIVYPGGSFALETGATWLNFVEYQELGLLRVLAVQLRARRRMAPAFTTLPLADADTAVLGKRISFYQDWLIHEEIGDAWWDPFDFGRDLSRVPPASLVGGWYDVFLPAQIDDYVALRAAGRDARLTIGPWTHISLRGAGAAVRDGIEWFDAHLRGDLSRLRPSPVRLFVLGAKRWADVPSWPPPGITQRWYLQPSGGLDRSLPAASDPDRYRWDPSQPTPGLGGPSLDATRAGGRNQRRREDRSDVITYSSAPLPADLTIAGPLHAEIWLRSSNWHTDLFVRLCDVSARGRSVNLSDGVLRLAPGGAGADAVVAMAGAVDGEVEAAGDGTVRVRIRMWPTAATFRRGHRVRLQVSGGAHPLFARNLGGGERLGAGTRLVAADHEIHHDPEHPSSIELPLSSI